MLSRLLLLSRQLPPRASLSTLTITRMASTFQLPSAPQARVSLPHNLTRDQLLAFPAFKNWLSTLQKSLALQESQVDHEFHARPYMLESIDVQTVDWFGGEGKRLGFVKMIAGVKNEEGEELPGAVFLRGGSVGMMVLLQPDDLPASSQEEKHVILTVQPRVAGGSLSFLELPAGMVDDSGSFAGAAAKEIEEELGLTIPASELIDLTELALPPNEGSETGKEALPRAMFPSPGGCDEHISLFLHERRVPRTELEEWTGKLTGLREEGEKITLKLVPVESMWREAGRDAKALGAWALWMGLRGEGKL